MACNCSQPVGILLLSGNESLISTTLKEAGVHHWINDSNMQLLRVESFGLGGGMDVGGIIADDFLRMFGEAGFSAQAIIGDGITDEVAEFNGGVVAILQSNHESPEADPRLADLIKGIASSDEVAYWMHWSGGRRDPKWMTEKVGEYFGEDAQEVPAAQQSAKGVVALMGALGGAM